MKKHGTIIAAAAALLCAGATAALGQDMPVDAATRWVSLIDAGRYADGWRASGHLFQSGLAADKWQEAIAPIRQPLGAVASRRADPVEARRSLPGAPDGDYRVVTFHTDFAGKHDAIETVVLAREADGWKVDGYFLR